jgi:hypothetical protein
MVVIVYEAVHVGIWSTIRICLARTQLVAKIWPTWIEIYNIWDHSFFVKLAHISCLPSTPLQALLALCPMGEHPAVNPHAQGWNLSGGMGFPLPHTPHARRPPAFAFAVRSCACVGVLPPYIVPTAWHYPFVACVAPWVGGFVVTRLWFWGFIKWHEWPCLKPWFLHELLGVVSMFHVVVTMLLGVTNTLGVVALCMVWWVWAHATVWVWKLAVFSTQILVKTHIMIPYVVAGVVHVFKPTHRIRFITYMGVHGCEGG